MKRIVVIFMLLFAVVFQAQAQVDYSFGNMRRSRKFKSIPFVGIKGGLTLYDIRFSDKDYNNLSNDMVVKPAFGLFIEFPLPKFRGFSIGAEVLMVERGMKKSFDHLGVSEVNQIKSQYVDFRIPVTYYFLISDYMNPYIFGAADVAFCYGGTDEVEFPNGEYPASSVDISKSDAVLTQLDMSLVAGAGVRFNVIFESFTMSIKLDASYNFGLLNVKSDVEGTPVNIYAYHAKENVKWHNRGVELMLSIGIPLKFNRMHDSCWGWK